jgi:hypothetical protein
MMSRLRRTVLACQLPVCAFSDLIPDLKIKKTLTNQEVDKGQGDPSKLNNNANGVNPQCRRICIFP